MSEIQVLDVRPALLTVPGQEILTSDGVALKISLTARYVVSDPVAAITNDQSWLAALYAALHAGLRDAVAGRTADDVLATRGEIGPQIAAAVASDLARIGRRAAERRRPRRDGPGRAQARLRRHRRGPSRGRGGARAGPRRDRPPCARSRTPGRLLEESPGLLQLRVIQQLGASSGNTIMLGIGGPDGRPPMPPPARRAAGSRWPRGVVGPARARPDHRATADLSRGGSV